MLSDPVFQLSFTCRSPHPARSLQLASSRPESCAALPANERWGC